MAVLAAANVTTFAAAAIPNYGFAFGGGGWLTAWYLGVLHALLASGAFKPGVTPVTGVSTGAQAAVVGCSGADPRVAFQDVLAAAQKCISGAKTPPCRGELGDVIADNLRLVLPADAAQKCAGTLTLGYSQPRKASGGGPYDPYPRMSAKRSFQLVAFNGTEDLIQGAAAAGYLHCLSGDGPYTAYRGRPTLAGGYSKHFICPRGAKCVRINSGVPGPGADTGGLRGPRGGGVFTEYAAPWSGLQAGDGLAGGEGGGAGGGPQGGGGGGAGDGAAVRRGGAAATQLPITCPVDLLLPVVPWNTKAEINPGRFGKMSVTWAQWQSVPVAYPYPDLLQYAWDSGVADGAAWSSQAGFVAASGVG